MRRLVPVLLLTGLAACGGSDGGTRSPTTPPPSPPPPQTWTLAGQVTDTVTGSPVAGATLAFPGNTVTAASGGEWQLQGTGFTVNQPVTISAPGYLPRETTVRWSSDGRTGIRLDLIAERVPFSLDYFRQLARNSFEEPDNLRAIRRWVRAPNFYIDTRNPRTERPLAASELRIIEEAIHAAVPQLTGGQFSAGEIEAAAAPFTPRPDYVEVVIVHEPDGDFCADARVGANPGRIRINYERCPSRCGAFASETVAHEVGHAMGFWHTEAEGIMHPFTTIGCDNLRFSDQEQFHARIAYSRPSGNMDVDRDPETFLAIEAGLPPRIFCKH